MTRRCGTMSSFVDGPWSCGSYGCPQDSTCAAAQRNEQETVVFEELQRRCEEENHWREALGLHLLVATRARARRIVGDAMHGMLAYNGIDYTRR